MSEQCIIYYPKRFALLTLCTALAQDIFTMRVALLTLCTIDTVYVNMVHVIWYRHCEMMLLMYHAVMSIDTFIPVAVYNTYSVGLMILR